MTEQHHFTSTKAFAERVAKTQLALERVISELDWWCDSWTPTSYNDPRISLRLIADRARNVLEKENNND